MHLSERVALVTGGAGGIGQAICRALNGAGAQIAVHYNTQVGPAQNLAAELGNGAAIFQADIAQPATAAALVGRGGAQDVGIKAGRYDVLKVHANGKVELSDGRRRIRFDPQKLSPTEQRDRLQLSEKKDLQLREGDRIRWTANDKERGMRNAALARVVGVDEVEQPVGLVGGELLGSQDSNVGDARIVNGRPVVDRGTPANPEVGALEQFEGRFLKGTLRKDEFQHHTNLPVAPPCQTRN